MRTRLTQRREYMAPMLRAVGAKPVDVNQTYAAQQAPMLITMFLPLQITLRNLAHSDALDELIRDRADKLLSFHPRISRCRVTVELAGHQQGKQFIVRVGVKVPGTEIEVDRQHSEDAHVAVREAFDAARRQLEDHIRVQRGQVKTHRAVGKVGG